MVTPCSDNFMRDEALILKVPTLDIEIRSMINNIHTKVPISHFKVDYRACSINKGLAYIILYMEPSAAQVSKIYSRRLPAFEPF